MQPNSIRAIHPRPKRKRVGRGNGGGQGTYAGKGMKGQNSRSGGGVRPGFEGGQNPQIKGLPMLRGFKNRFRTEYQVVSLNRLNDLPDSLTEITPATLKQHRMVRSQDKPIKILGDGELVRPVQIQASRFSNSARLKIEAVGGTVSETSPKREKEPKRKKKLAKAAAKANKVGSPPQNQSPMENLDLLKTDEEPLLTEDGGEE